MKLIFIVIALALFSIFPLMGIPGILVLTLAKPMINLIYGSLAWEAWMNGLGPGVWQLGIILSGIWPVSVPIGFYSVLKIFPESKFFSPKTFIIFLSIILLCCLILGQVYISTHASIKRLTRFEIVEAAIHSGNLKELKKNYNSSYRTRFKRDPLAQAIFDRKEDIAEFLITKRNKINDYHPHGNDRSIQFASPLHTAINVGSIFITRILLEKGASVSKVNKFNQTPLFAVSWDPEGDGEILRLLNSHKANFKHLDLEGNTPLIYMIQNVYNSWDKMTKYTQLFIDFGVNPLHKNDKGFTALDYAKKNHHREVIRLLQKL